MRAGLIGWRHKTHRWCKIQRTLGLRTKQWRTSFCDFWRVISRQKKLSRTRFMVISLRLHLYFAFLRKTVGKKIWKFRRSSTVNTTVSGFLLRGMLKGWTVYLNVFVLGQCKVGSHVFMPEGFVTAPWTFYWCCRPRLVLATTFLRSS